MKLPMLIAAVATSLTAVPAVAQDGASVFTGPRVEGRVGYDNATIRASVTDGVDRFSRSAGRSGAVYGGELGYDAAAGANVLIGGYVGLEGATTEECGELYGVDELCLSAGRSITAGARIGTRLGQRFAVYGKGGYSNTRVTFDYQDYEFIIPDYRESTNVDGFHLGAGVEGALPGGIYGRLEYVYTGYGEASATVDDITATLKPHRHQVVYGMGIRF